MSKLAKALIKSALNVQAPLAGNTLVDKLRFSEHGDPGIHSLFNRVAEKYGPRGEEIANKYREMAGNAARAGIKAEAGGQAGAYRNIHNQLATNIMKEVVKGKWEAINSGSVPAMKAFYNQKAIETPGGYNANLKHPRAASFDRFMRSGYGKATLGTAAVLGGAALAHHYLTKKKEDDHEEGQD
jgi:hypothetical protein